MKKNLLNASCILDQQNYAVIKKNALKIYNPEENLIAVATRNGKLFKLVGKITKNLNIECTSYTIFTEISEKEKWHHILGQANF